MQGLHTLAPAAPARHPTYGQRTALHGQRGRWDHRSLGRVGTPRPVLPPPRLAPRLRLLYGCIESRLHLPNGVRRTLLRLRAPLGSEKGDTARWKGSMYASSWASATSASRVVSHMHPVRRLLSEPPLAYCRRALSARSRPSRKVVRRGMSRRRRPPPSSPPPWSGCRADGGSHQARQTEHRCLRWWRRRPPRVAGR